jgi:pimeloyl-ACP methyl ester carboxylesterase
VRATENLLGREIPLGKGSAKSLRLTLDKVDCLHRSLLWYLVRHSPSLSMLVGEILMTNLQCICVVDTVMYYSMIYNGFHFHRTSLARLLMLFPIRPLTLFSAYRSPVKHLTYWHRPHTSKARLPVLFIHGIGIGLYPYTNFLREVYNAGEAEGDDGEVGIIALEIMPVSSRITHPALEKDVLVREIQAIVKCHGWSKFVLVSHSYGSIISTFLLKSPLTASSIGPIVLIDPISFLLHLPDVAYNFTARQPMRAKEYLLWYFGSKDMGVAHTLARRFFWSENIVWKEDLELETENGGQGRRVTVVLCGNDLIVNTEAVRQYLTGSTSEGFVENRKADRLTNCNGIAGVTKTVDEMTGDWKDTPWTGAGLEVIWFDTLDHAQVFDSEKARRPVIKAIIDYSAKG